MAGEPVTLSGYVNDGAARLKWTPSAGVINDTIANAIITTYSDRVYFLTAVNKDHCTSYDSVKIKVYQKVIVPNAFSPNGDGINDTWKIEYLSDYKDCKVEVFNRYGQVVFRSAGYRQNWNGKVNGAPIPFGIYYYVIHFNNKLVQPITGSLTILR